MDTTNQHKVNLTSAKQDDDDAIDLLEVGKELLRHWFTIFLVTLVCGSIAFCISKFLITPQYESTATMYILTKETTLASLADLQIGTQLTNDYQVVVTNRTVLQNTLDQLGLSDRLTYEDLVKKITTENPANTRMLQITAKDSDPETAMNIANTIAGNASEFIADMMEITPPKVIEKGILPVKKSSPKNVRNAIIGALAGLLLMSAFFVIRFLRNDAVTTEEDVSRYLDLSVLASLPDRSEDAGAKRSKSKKSIKR